MEDLKKAGEDLQEKLVNQSKFGSSNTTSGDNLSLDLLDLPVLTLKKIFSFLRVKDLKNIRLVSTRMNEVVLILEKRLKTWTIDISRGVPQEIDQMILQHNAKIEIKIKQPEELRNETDCWLKKHASCITGIILDIWNEKHLSHKLMDSLSGLNQVRKLELINVEEDDVTTLLTNFGPQLETLIIISEYEDPNTGVNLSNTSLCRLKHLRLVFSNKELRFSILKIVPDTIESLLIIENDDNSMLESIEFPSSMFKPYNLKDLEIRSFDWIKLHLPVELDCRSLTRLHLEDVDLEDLEPSKFNLPSLKILELVKCVNNNNWLAQLILACSSTLTTLKLSELDSFSLDEWTCELPALKVMSIMEMTDFDINDILRKCSSSLEILYLEIVKVDFKVNLSSLKELHMVQTVNWRSGETEVDGFTRLVSPEGSRLEIIGLECGVTGSIWDDVVECRFPNLKAVYTLEKDPVKCLKLKTSIITPYVQVITDRDEWRRHLLSDVNVMLVHIDSIYGNLANVHTDLSFAFDKGAEKCLT